MTADDEHTPPRGDRSSSRGAQGHFAVALRRGALSALLVADLRAGRSPTQETLAELGLSETHQYRAIAANADPSGELEHSISRSAAAGGLPVVHAVIDRWLFALVPGDLDASVEGVTVAQSSRQPLARATAAFSEAEQALSTARAFGVTGLVDLADLMPLPLVTATSALASTASTARFARLDALGPAGAEIEQAVAALLAHDQSIDATATALGVHRNTVRARRQRFHELTGLDIARTTDLVTTWWLLTSRRATRS